MSCDSDAEGGDMRVLNTVTRLAVALWITVLLNGAIVAAFDHAATQARVGASVDRTGNLT
jgi:hypothetical protein